ncbi:MAG: hypothetical protein EA412_11325 [Chitinophagaceae bacterium]|nr:MAG: hypothetical protein EA412_11325 [Chitinophagaceae bacterium]
MFLYTLNNNSTFYITLKVLHQKCYFKLKIRFCWKNLAWFDEMDMKFLVTWWGGSKKRGWHIPQTNTS